MTIPNFFFKGMNCTPTHQHAHAQLGWPNPGGQGLGLVKIVEQLQQQDSEWEHRAVSNEVHNEGGDADDPAPAAVGDKKLLARNENNWTLFFDIIALQITGAFFTNV